MINWKNGLSEDQQKLLRKMLSEEREIPIETHVLESNDSTIVLTGRLLPQNKLIPERNSGYSIYIETQDGLRRFSAFHWKLKNV